MSNKIMTCPHCLNEVKYGANVCTGCKAEILYGRAPRIVKVISLILIYMAIYWVFISSLKFALSMNWVDRNIGEGSNGLVVIGGMFIIGLVVYWIVSKTIFKRLYGRKIEYIRRVLN